MPLFDRRTLIALGAVVGALKTTDAMPAVPPRKPPDADAELRIHQDWAYIARYRDENAKLIASGAKVDAVFIGDSITDGWVSKCPAFFGPGRICRGIGGQTTPQLLVRFREDVVALKPRIVHIMGGTNDIAGNTGPMTPQLSHANFMSMAEIARANGISVVFASVTPAAFYPWQPLTETVGPIMALNAWLRDYAARTGGTFADYFSAMTDGKGGMRPGLSYDDVHPTEAGYTVMAPIAEAALNAAAGAAHADTP